MAPYQEASPGDRIIIFLKSCNIGRVKTRISAELGDSTTLELYTAMIKDLFRNLRPLKELLVPFCDVPPGLPLLLPSLPVLRQTHLQRGFDLGEKMFRAFTRVFEQGAERAVLIGSDIPYITGVLIRLYLRELRRHDAVLGPAVDGGYYLIGFTRESLTDKPFRSMSWGTDSVLEKTIERLEGHSLYMGSELQDMDRMRDLEAVLASEPLARRLTEVDGVFSKRGAWHGKARF
jgi:hypothetical protein